MSYGHCLSVVYELKTTYLLRNVCVLIKKTKNYQQSIFVDQKLSLPSCKKKIDLKKNQKSTKEINLIKNFDDNVST